MSTKRHSTDWEHASGTEHAPEHAPEHRSPPPAGMVRVRCISDTRPSTDRKALERGEEADVPEAIAKVMVEKKQVELV